MEKLLRQKIKPLGARASMSLFMQTILFLLMKLVVIHLKQKMDKLGDTPIYAQLKDDHSKEQQQRMYTSLSLVSWLPMESLSFVQNIWGKNNEKSL
jgi:hypothetical protein